MHKAAIDADADVPAGKEADSVCTAAAAAERAAKRVASMGAATGDDGSEDEALCEPPPPFSEQDIRRISARMEGLLQEAEDKTSRWYGWVGAHAQLEKEGLVGTTPR